MCQTRVREREGKLTELDEMIIDRLDVASVGDVEDGCGSIPGWGGEDKELNRDGVGTS